ncbi:MAG: hypothetical protein GF350_02865 [Chitinivibrionales bacterium]|nr:hypothetical protein [Chitinivibrionales bacterium]
MYINYRGKTAPRVRWKSMKRRIIIVSITLFVVLAGWITGGMIRQRNVIKILENSTPEQILPRLYKKKYPQVRVLKKAVGHHDETIRIKAAYALGETKDKRAVQSLVNALADFSPGVQRAAENALKKTGKPAIPALRRVMKNIKPGDNGERVAAIIVSIQGNDCADFMMQCVKRKNQYTRAYAAMALGMLKEKRAVDILIDAARDSNPFVRKFACEALGNLRMDNAVPVLVEALGNARFETRTAAAEALGKIKDTIATPALLAALDDSITEVVEYALMALDSTGDSKALVPLLHIVKEKGRIWNAHSDLLIRACTASGRTAIDTVKALLDDPDDDVNRIAMDIVNLSDNPAAEQILHAALNHPGYRVRKNAVVALGNRKDTSAVEKLIAMLNDTSSYIRRDAIIALGKIGSSRAIGPLVAIIESVPGQTSQHFDETAVWKAAVMNCGALKAGKAVAPLIRILSDTSLMQLRCFAAHALGEIGDSSAVKPLIACLDEKPPEQLIDNITPLDIRASSAIALGKIGDFRATKHLLQLFDKKEKALRLDVFRSLAKLKNPSSVPRVVEFLASTDSDLVEEAQASLIDITGQDFGGDADKWKSWLERNSGGTGDDG